MPFHSLVEAILFAYGEPITLERLTKLLNKEMPEIKEAVRILGDQLRSEDRGLDLILSDQKLQLVTKSSAAQIIELLVKSELTDDLTPAALETLTIVAYLGPIVKAEIDHLRGVNSHFIIRSLLLRGLIERSVDPKRLSVYLYQTSFDFLRHLGLNKTEDLPEYEKYRKLGIGH